MFDWRMVRVLVPLTWFTGILGCAWPGGSLDTPAAGRAELGAQISVTFTNGVLYKPLSTLGEGLASKLAPLIIQETLTDASPVHGHRPFGPLAHRMGEGSMGGMDSDRPAVYADEREVVLHGQSHPQVTFAWCYLAPGESTGQPLVRGVRMTLNSAGEPVIWEALSLGQTARIFFVAEFLETAAAAQHGAPLPERRHSIERSAADQPKIIVARVIDDGPVPMGPIIYLRAGSRQISTILCRCMPAQVSNIVENHTFELLPVESLPALSSSDSSEATQAANAIRTLTQRGVGNDGLDTCLRLPTRF